LVVLSFKKPIGHEKHMRQITAYLIQTEMSGILNWLLEGYAKLNKASQQLTQTQAQQTRTNVLLMASESPQAFVRSCLVKKKDAVMGVAELYETYQTWCRQHHLQPFTSRQFTQNVRTELEITLGLKYRHDLKNENGGMMRGWKGLALIETDEVQNVKKASVESDELARVE